VKLQHGCVIRSFECVDRTYQLTAEEYELVRGRIQVDEQSVQDTPTICQKHADLWLYRYRPQHCVVCHLPFSNIASSYLPCPEWLQREVYAHTGGFVHKRSCYSARLAAKKEREQQVQSEQASGLEILTAAAETEINPENKDPNTAIESEKATSNVSQ
jgi:hypothetical protein